MMDLARDTSQLQYGRGSALWDYWTKGKGLAKWSGALHKWTTLHRELIAAGVPRRMADGLTTNIIEHVFPGYMKQAHAKKGAMRMSTPAEPADLHESWDAGTPDVGDLSGLTIADFEAAHAEMPAAPQVARAAAKPGTGGRFEKLKGELAAKGAHDPAALAAWIGRKKYGRGAFAKLSAAARRTKKNTASRSEEPAAYARSFVLDDIQILRSADGHGDGRTVEAYAAVFDTPTEITDQHGHYMERIDRTAFNRTLKHGIDRVGVYYHHGLTVHGTPSDLGSVPIGSPLEIKPDGRGLRTVTRYNRSPLADSVIEAIRNGDIRGYSFRGRIFRSTPNRVPRVSRGSSLPTVTRTELGLQEYGPTPTPAYADAGILAMRSKLNEISAEIAELTRNFVSSTPSLDSDDFATPDPGPGAEDPRSAHSSRQRMLRLRRELLERGL